MALSVSCVLNCGGPFEGAIFLHLITFAEVLAITCCRTAREARLLWQLYIKILPVQVLLYRAKLSRCKHFADFYVFGLILEDKVCEKYVFYLRVATSPGL